MAEVTDRTAPAWVPTTNALANIPADLLGPVPRELRLGSNTLMILENPPARGSYIDVVLRLRVKGYGDDQPTPDGEVTYYMHTAKVGVWIKGEPEPPLPEEPQPALFGDDVPTDEPEKLGDVMDNVARPDVSSGEA